jgi:hypothetical protein
MSRPGPSSYNFKQPRSFNFVSIGLILLGLAAAYSGFKFGPVYYKRYKVDQILRETKAKANDLYRMQSDRKPAEKRRLLDSTTEQIEALGITAEDNELDVYFGEMDDSINADWVVTVTHPVGSPTVMKMHRSEALPQEAGGFGD